MGKAVAAEINLSSQENSTNSNNVKFDVYLDENNRNVKEKTAEINSEELELYISVSVQGGGYLNNPVIELVNTNFRLKNNPEITKFKLDSIQSEQGIVAGLPIVAKNNESYDLSLLDMQSQIKLTGEYIDENGNVTDIEATKALKMTWTANNLTDEDIILSQEIITNKIYNIDGENKRVVQLLVKSQVKDNKAPVKSSVIEIENPEIGAEPEEVIVAGYTTKATNGKTSLEFADGINSLWEYKDGKTRIQVINNPSDDNNVSWTKNAQDAFVVTYVYDESAEVTPFISNVKNTVEIYGRTTETIEKENSIDLEEVADIGDITKLETSITANIYKGKMYIGEDTDYEEVSNIYVPYSKIVKNIVLEDLEDEISENISTYYKATKINKAEALKVLGTEGTIKVYNEEDKTTPIQEIKLSEEIEGDYYTISYGDNISKIAIEMSSSISEGTIEIINEKAIKVLKKDEILELTKLTSNISLSVINANNSEIVKTNSTSTAKLLEPKTTYSISLDKNSISAQTENEVRITAELTSVNESNKLFSKPTLNIELPAEITECSIENITPIVGNDELEIKTYDVITNEAGNKVIVIELQGEQTKYSANAANIVIDIKLTTETFIADKNVQIKSTLVNDGETVENTNKISIISKSGLVTKSTIKVGDNQTEKINKNNISINTKRNEEIEIATSIINNYGDILSNGTIIGTVPEEATLKTEIKTNIKNAEIYYSEETNPSIDSENWETDITDLSKVKAFKVVAPSELAQGEMAVISYKYELNEVISDEQASTLKVSGTVEQKTVEETIKYLTNVEQVVGVPQTLTLEENTSGLKMELVPKTDTDTIHEGQIITYSINVTNTSLETLNNITLNYTVPEGAVLTELTYAQGSTMTYTDDESTKNKTWEIESIASNQTISKDVTIKVKEGASQIINGVSLVNSDASVIAEVTTDPIQVVSGDLTVRMSRRSNMVIGVNEGSEIQYIVIVKNNTDTPMNNVTIKSKAPNNTTWVADSEYNKEWTYNEQDKKIESTIDTLAAGETVIKQFVVKVDKLSNDISTTSIENSAVIIKDGVEYATNIFTSTLEKAIWQIEMSSDHSETLNIGDSVKYIIQVTNKGKTDSDVTVEDVLPEDIQVRKITYYVSEENKNISETTGNVEITNNIAEGETLTIEIEGVVLDIDDNLETKEITNIAKIDLGNGEYLESNAIVNTIINDEIPNGGENNNPSDNPEDNENDEGTNSISGIAWLDENKDGIKDEEEKVLQAIEVILLDKEGKEVEKTTTSITGTYKFSSIEQGEYTVVFVYDTSKYAVTKYQSESATEQTNSDVISKELEINGEKKVVAVTDTIKLQGQNITNIDIGLIENAKFDLSLKKFINKVVLTNSNGTTTYEYENTNFAKVEISAKKIEGTVMLVEYGLEITNEGDVDAYVEDLIDYLPDELVFTSETNKDWYMDGSGVLHNKTLAEQAIKAGETKNVTLVLTKTLKSDSTGTIENIGEIGVSSNKEGIAEYDSISGNKKTGEDDMSAASLIVSIATGSPIMYIGIVIASMLVIGLGIYVINKKVLKVRI